MHRPRGRETPPPVGDEFAGRATRQEGRERRCGILTLESNHRGRIAAPEDPPAPGQRLRGDERGWNSKGLSVAHGRLVLLRRLARGAHTIVIAIDTETTITTTIIVNRAS
jgi:hypothetical protein